MAKLAILGALLVLVMALAEASIYRSTITTTLEDEENQGGRGGSQSQRCSQQLQQQRQNLQFCQRYLSSSSPFDAMLALNTDDDQNSHHQQHLQQCCQALRNIQDEQCRCEAVRQAFRQAGQQGGQQAGQEQVRQRARFLPRECNVGPQECQV